MPIRAKAKAMSSHVAQASDLMVNLTDETRSEEWINMTSNISTEENIEALQARMTNMENAMTEILNFVRREPQ